MGGRSSKWAFIVYPESAPAEWKKLLKLQCVSFAVSPLHSPDSEGSGEERKKHYHVLLDFNTLKSEQQVINYSILVNATKPIIIDNPSAYYQYMIHKNDPDKEQFKDGFNAIEKFNGFDSDRFENYSKEQTDVFFKDIQKLITKNGFTEYDVLLDYLADNSDVENFKMYYRLARTNTIMINSYLCSRRNRIKKQQLDNINQRLLALETLFKGKK